MTVTKSFSHCDLRSEKAVTIGIGLLPSVEADSIFLKVAGGMESAVCCKDSPQVQSHCRYVFLGS